MWGRKDEPKEQLQPEPSRPLVSQRPAPTQPVTQEARPAGPRIAATTPTSGSRIGKSIQLKGSVSGKEDLQVDGVVEGKVELEDADLRVGPTGTVRADASARVIVIEGVIEGNLKASEKIEIHKTGSLEGDIVTVGISIQEGAMFRGSVDIVKRNQASPSASLAKKKVVSDQAPRPEEKIGPPDAKAAGAGPR